MSQIIAIALLSIRNAIRSKIVLSLLMLLLVVLVFLPLSIKGDGTIGGLIQLLLSYTLGLAGFILALTTLWAGSASVAAEINDKTIQMVTTKPVSRWQLWMGKWVGLTLMNAVLLALCGAVTYGMLQWHLQPSRLAHPDQREEAGRLLTARQSISPRQPDFAPMARQRLDEQLAREPLPAGVSREQARRELEQRIMMEHHTIRPAGQKRWEFGMVKPEADTSTLTLQYRFSSSRIGQGVTKGRWLIGTPERSDLITMVKDSVPRALNEVSFQLDDRWDNQPMVVTYIDMDDSGASFIFDSDGGLVVLVPRGGFIGNYVRSLLIVFGQLAFFTALGVTAGGLFSLPVAAFVSLFLLTIIQLGSYIQVVAQTQIVLPGRAAAPEEVMTGLAILVTLVFKAMALVLSPLIHENALNSIATGRLVDLAWTFRGFVLQGFVYSIVMSWFASYVMNRRELALPSS